MFEQMQKSANNKFGAFLKHKHKPKNAKYVVTDNYYTYTYVELLEWGKNIYSAGHEPFKSIVPNEIDCKILDQQEYGKFSCKRILDNECYKDKSKCLDIDKSIYNKVKFYNVAKPFPFLDTATATLVFGCIFALIFILFNCISNSVNMSSENDKFGFYCCY